MSAQPLRSIGLLKTRMAAYFRDLAEADTARDRPIAWCTSVGPAELLRALGFAVYFPENHGAMLGATREANACMSHAHAAGYSPDICSYLTSDIGAHLAGETPLRAYGMDAPPRADVLVFNTNQCRDVRDWFEYYGREWRVPVLGITAFRGVDEIDDALVDATARQIEQLVVPLEAIAGRRLGAADLEACVRSSRLASDGWKRCLETAVHRPAPLTFFDGTVHMFPAVVLRGDPAAPQDYDELHRELAARVASDTAAVTGEQYRLYWDGMPVWGRLRYLSELLAGLGASVVASTYCNSWVFDALDPADPFGSMARASLELFIARAEGPKERALEATVSRYAVDGVVFHDSRTCPNNSNARYGLPGRLRERLDLPVLILDGDLNDLRCFSDEQARTNLEGFVEQLAEAGRPEEAS